MGITEVTNGLMNSLGECYCKEYCTQKGWAFTSLEQIYKNKIQNSKLEFNLGFERILIHIPEEIRNEIETLARPNNNNEVNPSFVYDFLICSAHKNKNSGFIDNAKPDDFKWVEVKTGLSELSPNQLDVSKRIKIQLVICRIPNVTSSSYDVNMYWNSVEEDLKSLDEFY